MLMDDKSQLFRVRQLRRSPGLGGFRTVSFGSIDRKFFGRHREVLLPVGCLAANVLLSRICDERQRANLCRKTPTIATSV
jgi:hypothetical protein